MKMKKLLMLGTILLLFSGCSGNQDLRTSFPVNEEATIDYFTITCTGYELVNEYNDTTPKNGVFLKVNYKLTNKNSKPIAVVPDKFFKLYDNGNYVDAKGSDLTLEPDKETEYYVVFDTTIEDYYKVLFYSNVVTNNVAFDLGEMNQ